MKSGALIKKAKSYLKLINPVPPVGGLAITDSSLRFFMLRDGRPPLTASLRLAPGILENGAVKNREAFKNAVLSLRRDIFPAHKPVNVIVSLPGGSVYTQSFSMPILPDERLKEAVKLNLQMISPIDFQGAYAGWQKIGETFAEGGKLELLGAFVAADIVNQISAVLEEANFIITAVEFPALGLARLLSEGANVNPSEPYLLIDIIDEGVSLIVIKNLNLHFNHAHTWAAIQEEIGGKITEESFRDFLIQEVRKVLNFYSSHWGGSISNLLVAGKNLNPAIVSAMESNFSLKISNLAPARFPDLSPNWFAALGAAERGLLPRSEDNFISLTNAPVSERYHQARVLNFIKIWQKAFITVAVFAVILFGAADAFLYSQSAGLREKLENEAPTADLSEVMRLEESAREFNQLVNLALGAKEKSFNWSPVLEKIQKAADGVALTTIRIQGSAINMSGQAGSEALILAFKERLVQDSEFMDVSLPLQDIKAGLGNTVTFNLSLKLKNF